MDSREEKLATKSQINTVFHHFFASSADIALQGLLEGGPVAAQFHVPFAYGEASNLAERTIPPATSQPAHIVQQSALVVSTVFPQ